MSDITNTYQLTLDDVTLDDIGKVVCSDRSVYATKTAAVSASKTVVGMIAHVQGPNNNYQVDASSTSYRGLVISPTEFDGIFCTQGSKENKDYESCLDESRLSCKVGDWNRYNKNISGVSQTNLYKQGKSGHTHGLVTTMVAYNTSFPHPSNTSEWFIPTGSQWSMMLYDLENKAGQNIGSSEEIVYTSTSVVNNEKFTGSSMNSIFTAAGIDIIKSDGLYWSTSEIILNSGETSLMYVYASQYGCYKAYSKKSNLTTRLVFAF